MASNDLQWPQMASIAQRLLEATHFWGFLTSIDKHFFTTCFNGLRGQKYKLTEPEDIRGPLRPQLKNFNFAFVNFLLSAKTK